MPLNLPLLGSLISAGSNLIGGFMGSRSNAASNAENVAKQEEFAKNSIQWRVADAKAAGIHPAYALGATPMSFAPSSVGDTSMPAAISSMGGDISRAVQATNTSQGRMDAQVKALTLTRMGLENDLLAAQITKTKQGIGPPFPGTPGVIEGQGDVPLLVSPAEMRTPAKRFSTPTTSAQDMEDQYGEWVGDAYGFGRFLRDRWVNRGEMDFGKFGKY